MSKEDRLKEVERLINSEGMVVTVWDISRGEELTRRVLNDGVAWAAKFDNGILATYIAPNEKPFVFKPKSVEEDLDDVVVDDGDLRFRFMFVTEDEERKMIEEAKAEASPSVIEEELNLRTQEK